MCDDEHEKAEYELCEPFDIDDGELEGLSPQECFCLGVEWAYVKDALDHGRAFERPMRLDNRERIEAMCLRRGRDFTIEPTADGWAQLTVEAM